MSCPPARWRAFCRHSSALALPAGARPPPSRRAAPGREPPFLPAARAPTPRFPSGLPLCSGHPGRSGGNPRSLRSASPPVILRSGSDEGSVSPAAGDWDGKRSFAALRMTRRENTRDDEDRGMPGMTRTRRCPGRCREVPRKTGGEQCAVRQRQSPKSEECLPLSS